jgi:hypothetical protein
VQLLCGRKDLGHYRARKACASYRSNFATVRHSVPVQLKTVRSTPSGNRTRDVRFALYTGVEPYSGDD